MSQKSALLPGLVQWTLENSENSSHSCEFGCGYLFLDVCGFTKLTEKVSAKGHYGVEVITNLLNNYFDLLNEQITRYGGQILKFEGDAVLAAFVLPKAICLQKLEACMRDFNIALAKLNTTLEAEYGSSLAYHGSMGYGTSQMIILGSAEVHLDYIIYSSVLGKLYTLCEKAAKGETLLVEYNQDSIEGSGVLECACDLSAIPQYADSHIDAGFFPQLILERSQSSDFSGELRNSAILFIGVDAEEFIHFQLYDEINSYYCAVQEIVYRLQGMLNKIDYTDKGMILLISFGIIQTHVDDIERAIICATEINRIESRIKAKIGLTYSNLYAGILGASNRYEYGIIGNGVNVAARLMSSAEPGQIVFTRSILSSVETRFEVQFLRKMLVKGIKDEVEFYLIVREIPEYVSTYIKQFQDKKLISYQDEIGRIISQIEANKLRQVLILGKHGTGKSFLGWQILKQFYAEQKRISVFVLDEFNMHDRLVIIRKLLSKALGCSDPLTDVAKLKSYLTQRVSEADADILINYLEARGMDAIGAEDGSRKHELMLQSMLRSLGALLQDYDFILIDNIQWLDTLSLNILKRRLEMSDKSKQVLILTSTEEQQLSLLEGSGKKSSVLNLIELSKKPVVDLIRSRIPMITNNATEYIFNLAGGNPRFIVELCQQICSHYPDPDHLVTTPDIQEIENKGLLPYSVENLFIIKYETLSIAAKELLKKASIIGKGFTLGEILETQSIIDPEEINSVITELKEKGILDTTDLAPEVQYLFSNVLMRSAVYGTILLKEKKDLHSRIASYYEAKYADRADSFSELLAYHFHLGEEKAKALHYSKLAAIQNQAVYSHGESIYYYQIALDCTDIPEELAAIKLGIVDSKFYLGDIEGAQQLLAELTDITFSAADLKAKYHYMYSRIMYLTANYEDLINYHAKLGELCGNYGEYTLIYRLDSLYKLYKWDEFSALFEELKLRFEKSAAVALELKDLTLKLMLSKQFSSLIPPVLSTTQKHYLYLLLKLESIRVTNLIDTANYKGALECVQDQLRLATILKDDLSLRIAYSLLGICYARLNKKDKAYQAYVEAINIADRISDRVGFAKVLCDLGALHRQMGENKRAMQNYLRSLKMFETLGNLYFQGLIHHNIGEVHLQEGKYEAALKEFRKASKVAKASGDLFGMSFENDAIGDILFLTNKIPEAKALYHKNLKLQLSINDKGGLAHTYGNMGNVADNEGNYPEALDYFAKNIQMTEEIGDLDGSARAYFNLARVHGNMGDKAKELELLHEALKRFTEAGSVAFIEQTRLRIKELKQAKKPRKK
ncbi:MAG: tetratricopeptide repeat protein [Candidatus Cloacimonetes bacterium]|nr:tetratricopeptide repeat protein [Candidatus Cloacimonadota bacterium]